LGEESEQVQREVGNVEPYLGVRAGADVGVDATHSDAVLAGNLLHFFLLFVPDAEGGARPTHILRIKYEFKSLKK
jgi:hypothetical protein